MTHDDINRPHVSRDPLTGRPVAGGEPFHGADADGPVFTAAEVRQGPPGRSVLYVLIAGLVLALIAWAVVEMYPSAGSQTAWPGPGEPATTGTSPQRTPTAGHIPISPPPGSPEAAPTPPSPPSPTSDSAR